MRRFRSLVSKLQTKRGITVLLVVALLLGSSLGYAYHNVTKTNGSVYNANSTNANAKLDSHITATNSSASSDSTINVPCGCKNKPGQVSQPTASASSLQSGSGTPEGVPVCDPCPVGGDSSVDTVCPEHLCRAPSPSPTPTPTPTPNPYPGCGTCGGGGTKSNMYMCPMIACPY